MNNPKIFCIGDVHGELGKLRSLFSKLDINQNDTVVFLGDYIDRGPDSKGVIDFIIDLKTKTNVIALIGNHELMALESFAAISQSNNPSMFNSWMRNGGLTTLNSYNKEKTDDRYYNAVVFEMFAQHQENFFSHLQTTYETDGFIFVHGYLSAERPVCEQILDLCVWSRFESIKPHHSGKVVVCGHTIQNQPVDLGYKICIDTGSFKKDGYITAMVIEGSQYTFVSSEK